MIRNLPAKWDLEVDVVCVGSGIGGLSTAITAVDNGASAIILERDDMIGGVTALSFGEVWVPGNHHAAALGINDSPESGFGYMKRLAMDYGEDWAMLNFAVNAPVALKYFEDKAGVKMRVCRWTPDYYYGISNDAVSEGRMLEVEPFPAEQLGDWQKKTRISPHVPWGMSHVDIYDQHGIIPVKKWDFNLMAERLTKDIRCLGPGLAAFFVKGVLDRKVPIHTGMNVVELIADGKRVVGVRAIKDGKDVFVKGNKGVLIAVSSYERNSNYNKTLGNQLGLESLAPPTVDGANFRLAGPVGARIAKVPEITMLAFRVPGEEQENGEYLWRGAVQPTGRPHTIVVNRAGKRFANEAFYRALFYAVDFIDGGTQTHPNYPCWVILDSQAREKYAFGSVMPGQDLPDGMGAKGNTLEELAAKIGVDPKGLVENVAKFNANAEKGVDPDFQRGTHPWSHWMSGDSNQKPNPNLGPLTKGPFYAVPLQRIGDVAVPATGIVTDHHCRAVGWDDKPIEGLYLAGNSTARLESGSFMQSGMSNARGMTQGYLAGLHATGKASDLLEKEMKRLGL